jgi:hypothetical protein
MREKQPRLLVIWGKYELSFDPSEPEAYRRDVSKAEVHLVDGGHFALDTAADQIAPLVGGFVKYRRESAVTNSVDSSLISTNAIRSRPPTIIVLTTTLSPLKSCWSYD